MMKPYPHTYSVGARGSTTGTVPVTSHGIPILETAPPLEFDGPGDAWSPETLLVAAVASCFILTFRGIARAAKFPWEQLECQVDAVLDRVSGVSQFSKFNTLATLTVKLGADHTKAQELMERAEKFCLVANSLRGERIVKTQVLETVG